MGAIDIVFSVVMGLSVLVGLWRGMTRELVSVIAWILIGVLAWRFAAPLGALIPFDFGWPFAQTLAGVAIIVLAGVLFSVVVGQALRKLVAASPLAGADRVLGAVFGAVRACLAMLVVAAIMVEGGFTSHSFWRDSASGPVLEKLWRRAAGANPVPRVPVVLQAPTTL
jgi:membrane protein required for colicin V production